MNELTPKYCPVGDPEYAEYKARIVLALTKIDESHSILIALNKNSVYLEQISQTLALMKDKFVDVALGKGTVPLDTVKEMLAEQRNSHSLTLSDIQRAHNLLLKSVLKIGGVIIVVLIGLRYLLPRWFGAN